MKIYNKDITEGIQFVRYISPTVIHVYQTIAKGVITDLADLTYTVADNTTGTYTGLTGDIFAVVGSPSNDVAGVYGDDAVLKYDGADISLVAYTVGTPSSFINLSSKNATFKLSYSNIALTPYRPNMLLPLSTQPAQVTKVSERHFYWTGGFIPTEALVDLYLDGVLAESEIPTNQALYVDIDGTVLTPVAGLINSEIAGAGKVDVLDVDAPYDLYSIYIPATRTMVSIPRNEWGNPTGLLWESETLATGTLGYINGVTKPVIISESFNEDFTTSSRIISFSEIDFADNYVINRNAVSTNYIPKATEEDLSASWTENKLADVVATEVTDADSTKSLLKKLVKLLQGS